MLLYCMLSTESASETVKSHRVSDFDMQVIEEPPNQGRVQQGYMYCPCSKSSSMRQASQASNLVRRSLNFLRKANESLSLSSQASKFLEDCTTLYSLEDCINGDAQLRTNSTKSLCTYDAVTGRNIVPNTRLYSTTETAGEEHKKVYTTVGSCNEHAEMARRQPVPLQLNSTRVRVGSMECDCSPTNSLPELGPFKEIMGAQKENATGSLSYSLMAECRRIFSKQGCINSDRALRSSYPRPLCTYDVGSGRNLKLRNGSTYIPVGTCARDRNLVIGRSSSGKVNGANANWVTEGCIAIEHLQNNFPLLHEKHLRRTVYCYNGFCATPNHAIIVQGVGYTSMKRECSKTITAFDFRYPKVAVWIVQIVLESLRFLENIPVTAVLSGVVFILFRMPFRKA